MNGISKEIEHSLIHRRRLLLFPTGHAHCKAEAQTSVQQGKGLQLATDSALSFVPFSVTWDVYVLCLFESRGRDSNAARRHSFPILHVLVRASIPPQVRSFVLALLHDIQAQDRKIRDISENTRMPGCTGDKENALKSTPNGMADMQLQKRVDSIEGRLKDSMEVVSGLKSAVEESCASHKKLEGQLNHLRDSMKEAITASSMDVLETAKKIVSAEAKALLSGTGQSDRCNGEILNKLEADVLKLTACCEGFEDRLGILRLDLNGMKFTSASTRENENLESNFREEMVDIHRRLHELELRTGGSEKAWKSIRKTMEDTLLDVKIMKNKGKSSNGSTLHQSVATTNSIEEICGEPGRRVDQIESTVLEVQKQTKKLERAVLGSSMRNSLTQFITNFPTFECTFPKGTEGHSSSLATQLHGLQSHVQDVTNQVTNLANMFFELEAKMDSMCQRNASMPDTMKSIEENDVGNDLVSAKIDATSQIQELDPDIYKEIESIKTEVLSLKAKQKEMHDSFRSLFQESADVERLHTDFMDLRAEMQKVDEKMEEYPTMMQVVELANMAIAKSSTAPQNPTSQPSANPAKSANEKKPTELDEPNPIQELAGRLVRLDQKIHHIYKQHSRDVIKRIGVMEGAIAKIGLRNETDQTQPSGSTLREEMYESFRAVNLRLISAEKKGEELEEVRRLVHKLANKVGTKVDASKVSHYLQGFEISTRTDLKEMRNKLERIAREQALKVDMATFMSIAGPRAAALQNVPTKAPIIPSPHMTQWNESLERSPPLRISLPNFCERNEARDASA